MKKFAVLFATLATSQLVSGADPAPPPAASELTAAATTLRILEKGEWTPLFDGKSLAGWKGEGYAVEEGAIVCTPKGAFLQTEKEYGDFVLAFDFKLKAGSNNGVSLRYAGEGDGAYTGMEIQVLDDRDPKYADLAEYQFHGSVYGISPSTQSKKNLLKPVGEWNEEIIVCINDHIKVILNGETITECFLTDMKTIDGKEHPGMLRKSGKIAFCGHGDYVAYRNLRIQDFTSSPPVLAGNADNTPPKGYTALFNGKDLTGWHGMVGDGNPFVRRAMAPADLEKAQKEADAKAQAHWIVKNGEIVFDGMGQNLCTDKPYGDFDFYVDWNIPATADSGIYLRSTPQVQIWDPADTNQHKHGSDMGSGAFWNNKKAGNRPLVKADNPTGEWNTFHIRMVGERATIHLNGKLIIDNVVLEGFWPQSNGRVLREELIELQNHGNTLHFKNIYLRELPY